MHVFASSKCASRFWSLGSSSFRRSAVATAKSTGASRRSPSSELAQVAESEVVVGVGLPERRAEAQVVEHDTKRPQVIRLARHVLLEKRRVDLARVLVGGGEQDLGHLRRAEAGARDLVAKGLADLAEDVEVDDLPRVAVADGVERLEVGVDATLAVHVVERQAQVGGNVADCGPVLSGDLLVVDCVLEVAVCKLQHDQELLTPVTGRGGGGGLVRLLLAGEEVRLDAAAEARHALQHDIFQACGRAQHRVPRAGVDGLLVRIDRLDGDDVPWCEADTPLELGAHLRHLAHRLERHPRHRLGLGVAVVGGGGNGGGGRAVEELAVVDFVAAEQEEGGLHRLLARRVGDVDGAAAVGVGEPGERGSGLDGLGEPVGVGGVGDDGLEEGGHRQRVGEQEGVQLARGALARRDGKEECVGRDGGLRRSSPFVGGAWGEGQLIAADEPEVGGSSFSSGQTLRASSVRAFSCPISGGSSFSGQSSRSSPWTRSSLHVTPLHKRGLSPSGHHSCSAGLAARIARSASSSAFDISKFFSPRQRGTNWLLQGQLGRFLRKALKNAGCGQSTAN
eukprot:scaffold52577_cov64-Phaeocystis_antarctica.AAC.1